MNENIIARLRASSSKYPMMSQSESDDPIVFATFTQVNGWKYFIYEYDANTDIAFGYVMGDFSEFGSISMDEQIEVANMYGHNLETSFQIINMPLSKISDFNS